MQGIEVKGNRWWIRISISIMSKIKGLNRGLDPHQGINGCHSIESSKWWMHLWSREKGSLKITQVIELIIKFSYWTFHNLLWSLTFHLISFNIFWLLDLNSSFVLPVVVLAYKVETCNKKKTKNFLLTIFLIINFWSSKLQRRLLINFKVYISSNFHF